MSPSSRPRLWTFTHAALLALLVFGTFEVLSYAFGEYSRRNGNPYFIYRSDFFARLDPAEVAKRRYRPLGWPREQREPRTDPAKFGRICASAFGDSFTYGEEVENDQTWPHAVADALKCEVRNFGVGAYGLDQALLRYELLMPETPIVLVGIIIEMLRREVAASWVFYAGRDIPAKYGFPPYFYEKPYFLLRGNELIEVPLPPDPVTSSHMERHHQYDYYRRELWTRLDFPYSLSVVRALHRYFMRDPMSFSGPLFWQQQHPSGAAKLALGLLDRLAKQGQ